MFITPDHLWRSEEAAKWLLIMSDPLRARDQRLSELERVDNSTGALLSLAERLASGRLTALWRLPTGEIVRGKGTTLWTGESAWQIVNDGGFQCTGDGLLILDGAGDRKHYLSSFVDLLFDRGELLRSYGFEVVPPTNTASQDAAAKTDPKPAIPRTGTAGRPSLADMAIAEMQRRADAGEISRSLAGEVKALIGFLREKAVEFELPAQIPKQGSLENSVRDEFNRLKQATKPGP